MHIKETLRALVGGSAVYVAMAACAGTIGDGAPRGAAGATGATTGGPTAGSATTGGSGGSAGLLDPVPSAQAQSGTRLKAIWFVGGDGSKQFSLQWHDTARNEDCQFFQFSGGIYCVPPAMWTPTPADLSMYVTGRYVTD